MKIIHIITSLTDGGAEGVLYRLCKYDANVEHIVVSLMDLGKYGSLLKNEGVEVFCLNLNRGKLSFLSLYNLYKFIRYHKPSVVQTWMYHADLVGGIVAFLACVPKVVWNIRHSSFETSTTKFSTLVVVKLCSYLSAVIPSRIICCADDAVPIHVSKGYCQSKFVVISNGFDTSEYSINPNFAKAFRSKLSISSNQILLGMVGRFHPQKDHYGLLSALSIVKKTYSDFKIVLVGNDLNFMNHKLYDAIERFSLQDNVFLLGQRSDISCIMNGLDIHILSSSHGEAFPNVLAEAMSCGTPCVTTDVGDASSIVSDTGWCVPPSDPYFLADAILFAINERLFDFESWRNRSIACRSRIVDNYGIDKMINSYHRVWFD
jgi:glycosyltransferase involved in cell wall biosynthesis